MGKPGYLSAKPNGSAGGEDDQSKDGQKELSGLVHVGFHGKNCGLEAGKLQLVGT